MNKRSIKNIYIPKLRFKGFNKKYKNVKLKDISTYKKGKDFSKKDLDDNGKNPIILYGDLFTQYTSIIKNINQFTNESGGYLSKRNTLLFPSSSTSLNDFFPCSAIDIENVILGSDINIFEFNINNIAMYFSYLFSTPYHLKNVFKLTEGSTINHLYGRYLESYNLMIPKINEQEKITKFFSLLDQQISLLENKLQLIEQIRLFLNNSLYKNSYKNGDEYFLKELLENPKKEPIKNVDEYTPIKIMLNGKGFIKSNLDVKITNKGRKYYERSSGELIIGLQNFHNKSIAILDDQFFKPIMSSAIASFISKSDDDLFIIKEMLLNKNHQNYILNNASGTGQKEYTVNKILQTKIKLPSKEIQQNYKNKFIKIDLFIRMLNNKIKILNYRKLFYLKNIFI